MSIVGVTRIELATSATPSRRSTDDLHPVILLYFIITTFKPKILQFIIFNQDFGFKVILRDLQTRVNVLIIPSMAVQSSMLPLGTLAPDFNLVDVISNQLISLESLRDKKALLVMFICRHCPYVKHVQEYLSILSKDYQDKDVGIVSISSNDIAAYPEDAPSSLKEQAQELGFTFPYLFDEYQEVAKAFTAACTPDFFLFDKERKLIYRGQLDDSRPGNNIPFTGKDLREAIDAVLNDESVNPNQKPSMGCSIKWKAGNEPLS
ncbi:MAG: hypothetical protein G01um10147_693 [Microgenomates group bacterium Gr01-1014_7]|nr:MAG: hypothetical protein G01um10147_693 [Microgenomates group bacterium Gr01-1014_7]